MRDFGYLDWVAGREKEASVIERFGVFEATVEEEDVVAKHPNATGLPVLEAAAVKHREKRKTEQVPRMRIVLHGGQEKGLVDGQPALFDPSGEIQAARPHEVRTAIVTGRARGSRGKKADVSGAYLNTTNTKPTYARLPRWLRVRLFGNEETSRDR